MLVCWDVHADRNPDEVGRRQVSEETNHEDEKEKHFLSWMMEALILVPFASKRKIE